MKIFYLLPIVIVIIFISITLNHLIYIIPIQECVEGAKVYGFWNGLWHGMISIISLIASLFNHDIAVYAINNNGAWYNLGFIMGVNALAGSGSKMIQNKK
jgi:general stress protein CsbA